MACALLAGVFVSAGTFVTANLIANVEPTRSPGTEVAETSLIIAVTLLLVAANVWARCIGRTPDVFMRFAPHTVIWVVTWGTASTSPPGLRVAGSTALYCAVAVIWSVSALFLRRVVSQVLAGAQ